MKYIRIISNKKPNIRTIHNCNDPYVLRLIYQDKISKRYLFIKSKLFSSHEIVIPEGTMRISSEKIKLNNINPITKEIEAYFQYDDNLYIMI